MRAFLTALTTSMIVLPAAAQQLSVSPVLIEAPAKGGAASISIGSTLDHPVTIQVRIFDWDQAEGGDHLTPARTVRFAPEIFTLDPGDTQIVRMLVPDTGGTGHWRLVIDELPREEPIIPVAGPAQLNIRLRYVVSMFASTSGDPGMLAIEEENGGITLTNTGGQYLRLHSLDFETGDGSVDHARSSINYVLPGATVTVPYPAEDAAYTGLAYSIGQTRYHHDLDTGK